MRQELDEHLVGATVSDGRQRLDRQRAREVALVRERPQVDEKSRRVCRSAGRLGELGRSSHRPDEVVRRDDAMELVHDRPVGGVPAPLGTGCDVMLEHLDERHRVTLPLLVLIQR